MDKYYNKEYHESLHNYLCVDKEYYKLRARLAYEYYWKDMQYESKDILEFGMGMGHNIYELAKARTEGIMVNGYDVSKFAVDFCKKKGIDATNDYNSLGQFDIIFSAHVLEHLLNPLDTLIQLKNKLKPNGKLILMLPREIHEKVELKPNISRHLWCWNFECINNLLDEAGYKVIENSWHRYGSGFMKLKAIGKRSFVLYRFLTMIAGRLVNAKELKIVAVKNEIH